MVMGDLNAKLGSDTSTNWSGVAGKFIPIQRNCAPRQGRFNEQRGRIYFEL